ncbi:MAG: hypothetical protein ACLR23_01830 [Clostridia bacterium]
MDTLLEQLKTNPQDRRMMLNLWQIHIWIRERSTPVVFSPCGT